MRVIIWSRLQYHYAERLAAIWKIAGLCDTPGAF
jgi:hypothetical protein